MCHFRQDDPGQPPSHPIDRIRKETGKGGVLVHLDQSKAFYRVDHQYLEVILEITGLCPGFRSRISAIYGNIKFIVQVNDYLLEPFFIK